MGEGRKPTAGRIEAITIVAAFLAYAEREDSTMMFGSWTVGEAVEAMAWLLGFKPHELRRICGVPSGLHRDGQGEG